MAGRKPKGKPVSQARAQAARENGRRGGRPPGDGDRGPRGIGWASIRRYARLGGDRGTIITALGIPAARLRDPEVLRRLQQEMDRGDALHKLDLLENVEALRKEGSVNATIASLREKLGWDRHDGGPQDQKPPDDESAVAELEQVLKRFRAAR